MKLKSARFGMAVKLGGMTDFYWDTDKQKDCVMTWDGNFIKVELKGQHIYVPMPNVAQFTALEEVKLEAKRKSAG